MFSLHYSAVACIKKAYTHSLNTALMDLLHKSDGNHEFAANVDRKASIKQTLSFYSSLHILDTLCLIFFKVFYRV